MVDQTLLEKLASGNASEEELKEFWRTIEDLPAQDFDSLMDAYEEVWAKQADYGQPNMAALQGIKARKEAYDIEQYNSVVRTRLFRWGAAAACVGIIIFGTLAHYHHKQSPNTAAPSMAIAPGRPKAILRLQNGAALTLDSIAVGSVVTWAGGKIHKTTSGQLDYQSLDQTKSAVSTNILEVPRGGEYQLVLPDSTHVWLNSASSITFPSTFTGNARTVQVTGEAYFEVAKDPSKPFYVSVGGIQIAVLGTEFNVMAYPEEPSLQATLVNGSIRVSRGNQSEILRPGELIGFSGTGFQVERPDLEQVLAWRHGEFGFDGVPLQVIMRQVARWYDVDVQYKGDMSNISLEGIISRKDSANQLLQILEKTGKAHFTIQGRTITVMPASSTN